MVEDQLRPPLDLVTVSQEQEFHNPTAELSAGHLCMQYSM